MRVHWTVLLQGWSVPVLPPMAAVLLRQMKQAAVLPARELRSAPEEILRILRTAHHPPVRRLRAGFLWGWVPPAVRGGGCREAPAFQRKAGRPVHRSPGQAIPFFLAWVIPPFLVWIKWIPCWWL